MESPLDVQKEVSLWNPLVVQCGLYSPLMSGSIDGTDSIPHDKAIQRALKSNYRPNKLLSGDPENTIFVARLSHRTTQDVLKNAFSKYGDIKSCRVVRDIVTGRSMGYAFVEFCCADDAENAYEECHEMYLDGSQLIVDYECERLLPGWVPRRFGGGLGGRKESGQLRFGGRDRPFRKPIVLGRQGSRRTSSDHDHSRRTERETGRYSRQESREPHRHQGRRDFPDRSHHRDHDRDRQPRRTSYHGQSYSDRTERSPSRHRHGKHGTSQSRSQRTHRSRSRSRSR